MGVTERSVYVCEEVFLEIDDAVLPVPTAKDEALRNAVDAAMLVKVLDHDDDEGEEMLEKE